MTRMSGDPFQTRAEASFFMDGELLVVRFLRLNARKTVGMRSRAIMSDDQAWTCIKIHFHFYLRDRCHWLLLLWSGIMSVIFVTPGILVHLPHRGSQDD